MNKRRWYLIGVLLVAVALLGPAAYAQWSAGRDPAGASSAGGSLVQAPPAQQPITKEPGVAGPSNPAPDNQPASASPGTDEHPKKADPNPEPNNPPPVAGEPGQKSAGPGRDSQGRVTPGPPPAADQGCRVYVAVVGKGKQVLFGPAQVSLSPGQKWGATALGALDATGLEYHLAYGNKFVDMVAGQANQGQWGWMYKVNDQVIWKPAVDVEVKPGDKIIWWYSQDRSPGPTWSELSK